MDIKNDSPLLSTMADILGGMGAIHESLNDSIKHWYETEGEKRKVKEALDKLEIHSKVAGEAAKEIGVTSLFNGKEFELFKNGPLSFSNWFLDGSILQFLRRALRNGTTQYDGLTRQ